jgi:hypothetical protein
VGVDQLLTADGKTVYLLPRADARIPGFPDSRIIGYVNPTKNPPLVNREVKPILDCDIIITTVDRQAVSDSPNHIKQCLEPIKDKIVHLMPDCKSVEYLGDLPETVKVHRWTNLQLHRQSTLRKGPRAAYNYARCLTFSDRDALILEDDVILDDDWEARVISALSRIPEDRFILAIHQNWDWAIRSAPGDEVTAFVSPVFWHGSGDEAFVSHWAGTNAVYYPRSVLSSGLGTGILNELNSNPSSHRIAYDMFISKWCYMYDVPVYLMTPSAARNVGSVTSIEWNRIGLYDKPLV